MKPGFFQNEDVAELPPETRLLFIGLWLMADREGRLEDRPKRIKMQIFPADSWDVEPMLAGLHGAGLIVRYEVDGGQYIAIPKFLDHQRPHHQEKQSVIPPPGEVRAKVRSGSDEGACLSALIPDSLNDDSLNPLPTVERPRKKPAKRCPKEFQVTEDLQAWAADFQNVDLNAETAKFRDHEFAKARSDWPAAWRNWIRKAAEYAKPATDIGEDPYFANLRRSSANH